MQNTTQPIDRASLLIEANKLIRDHEDTLAGIEATGVEQRNGVLVFSGEYFLDEQGLPTRKAPPCLTCLNTWRIPSQRSTTWSIKTKTRGICLAFFFTAAAFVRAATSVAAGDPRFLPHYW